MKVYKINPAYSFHNLITGSFNKHVVEHGASIANNKWDQHFNPVVITGKSGMGKTHILQAIVNEIASKMNVGYYTAQHLTSGLIDAIKKGETKRFNKFLTSLELLLIDDLDYFEGKDKTQEFLIQIIDDFVTRSKAVVLSTRKAVRDLDIKDNFKSRLLGGLSLKIGDPDRYDLESFITEKSNQLNIVIDDQTMRDIASINFTNLSELKGAILSINKSKSN